MRANLDSMPQVSLMDLVRKRLDLEERLLHCQGELTKAAAALKEIELRINSIDDDIIVKAYHIKHPADAVIVARDKAVSITDEVRIYPIAQME